ncbi:MAG: hypothetical protein AUK46_04780 [Flavobacteriaceae bacterium CG2_30_31_66]|nr:MAG: hypothetical protein AUK46_04780 [Flavobacteriaceae bacterium CG2_30_31_66]
MLRESNPYMIPPSLQATPAHVIASDAGAWQSLALPNPKTLKQVQDNNLKRVVFTILTNQTTETLKLLNNQLANR